MTQSTPIPEDHPVQPVLPGQRFVIDPVTCGTCGRTWDDGLATSLTPAPSARCPFEPFHEDEDEPESFDVVSFVIAFEDGTLDHDELVDGFQRLVDDGTAWRLQGVYGRTAQVLIDAGLVTA